jgi:hypothetical protein
MEHRNVTRLKAGGASSNSRRIKGASYERIGNNQANSGKGWTTQADVKSLLEALTAVVKEAEQTA